MTVTASTDTDVDPSDDRGFAVHLDNFEGPFDLLLGLIAKHQMDITEVALSQVTDEFIAHLKRLGPDLEQTTQFLVVAATLLDLKTARLLPAGDVEDEEDLALLEARDLLFARLLQSGWTRGSPACCRRWCSASGWTSSPRWRPGRSRPGWSRSCPCPICTRRRSASGSRQR